MEPDLSKVFRTVRQGAVERVREQPLSAFFMMHGLAHPHRNDDTRPLPPMNAACWNSDPSNHCGPLVSVLFTTFNSADRISEAIVSILRQSWSFLEIIVVDDASTDKTRDTVREMTARDSRIKLICLPSNVGTYAAKHIGLQHATGEFVTCHDSDDWSHPQKIERQVRPLIDNPHLVCTVSCWIRITDKGEFYSRLGPPYMRLNPSSPLFRRELVLERAGAWDLVRTGADSEFLARIKAVFGEKAVLRIGQPLALGSHRPGSLMTAEDTGYSAEGRSNLRQAYWGSWNEWHAAAKARGSHPWLPPNPVLAATHRMFDAPEELTVPVSVIAETMKAHGVDGFMDAPSYRPHWLAHSSAVAHIPMLAALVGGPVLLDDRLAQRDGRLAGVLAWGRKPSALRAAGRAADLRLPLLQLEDGFLRSFSTGHRSPPLALVLDDTGIYYDCTRPSAIEGLLDSSNSALVGSERLVDQALQVLREKGLSKYNHARDLDLRLLRFARNHGLPQRVLVIDQTMGDSSVSLGGASAQTFADMLAAARSENPLATIYVKTHPEVSSGRKGGYLTHLQADDRTVLLRAPVNPMSLIAHMDKVYVVTSTMGFEALLAGKPVVCFGVPWYAGWGVTDDRCKDSPAWARRTRKRSVNELFAAAYIHYTRYLDPVTHKRGNIMDVIHWLVHQKEMATRMHGTDRRRRVIGVGFRRWKAANLKPMLGLHAELVQFVPNAKKLAALDLNPEETVVCWGPSPPQVLSAFAHSKQLTLLYLEDGFIRSVGLGSDLICPLSLVLDQRGIYFDATRPSDLEHILATREFTAEDRQRAQQVRAFIIQHGITKYNLEPLQTVQWPSGERLVVLVPGQVKDDASIRFGCTTVCTNLDLLRAVREARPKAFIVYKPHPDVLSCNRKGRIALDAAFLYADHVETGVSVVSCIDACDEVHTMTSLSGFDALLRDKKVVTYGQPFYAGWGLTEDCALNATAFERRKRRLSLDELVAGTLLHYPIYWDWDLKGYTTCEAVLNRIVETRSKLEANGGLAHLRSGFFRRQWRKLGILIRAWWPDFIRLVRKA